MKKFKFIAVLMCFVLIAAMTIGCSSEGGSEETTTEGENREEMFLSVATGGTSGTYYPLGGAIANIITNNVEGVNAQAESTGASVENATLLQNSETDLALIQNDIVYYASTGTTIEAFENEGAYDNVKGLGVLYPEVIQLVAAADAGISSVEDLAGKNVAVGAPGSGTEANARQILEVHGLTFEDLGKADYLSFAEASDQLKNNQIDAAFVTAGVPTAAITEVSTTSDVVIVPIEGEKIQELSKEYPFYTEYAVPAGSYKGQDEEVPTAAVMAMLAVRGDLEEDVVYDITKSIFDNLDTVANSHEKGKEVSLETANKGMSIDLHPGALKYYEEVGAPLE